VRWLAVLVLLVATAATAKPSNPAFLGIGMSDLRPNGQRGQCMVTSITPDTGAQKAGLRNGDVIVRLDSRQIANCDVLVSLIQARDPGEVVEIEVERGGLAKTVKAQLLSRDEVLRRRFVGQPVPSGPLTRVDNRADISLDAQRTKTTIVGWYSTSCGNCSNLFRSIDAWTRRATRGTPVIAYGATTINENKSPEDAFAELQSAAKMLDVPLLATDSETFKSFSIGDIDRIHFMVIDCRGIVQYVEPIAPDGDDTDAALDELYAAAEQAARRMM
jgi:hypothetical protein